jgi:hypothetical protein
VDIIVVEVWLASCQVGEPILPVVVQDLNAIFFAFEHLDKLNAVEQKNFSIRRLANHRVLLCLFVFQKGHFLFLQYSPKHRLLSEKLTAEKQYLLGELFDFVGPLVADIIALFGVHFFQPHFVLNRD